MAIQPGTFFRLFQDFYSDRLKIPHFSKTYQCRSLFSTTSFATFKGPFPICGEWRMGWIRLTQFLASNIWRPCFLMTCRPYCRPTCRPNCQHFCRFSCRPSFFPAGPRPGSGQINVNPTIASLGYLHLQWNSVIMNSVNLMVNLIQKLTRL